jgi:hypothetical protein
VLIAMTALSSSTLGQPATTGSVGCSAITQAAANGMTARIQADDNSINPPQSVTSLSCLDNFFNGTGLNLVTNLLNPTNLLQAVEGQICNAVKQEWNSLVGSAQCGLTITGFNLGFGGGLHAGGQLFQGPGRGAGADHRRVQHRDGAV